MKKQKIILVNPAGISLVGDKTLPLALLSISLYIHKDYDIKILDLRHLSNWRKEIKAGLTDELLCVGITSMTGSQILSGIEVTKFVKSQKDVPIIWGGIHATGLPEQTIECPLIDYVVQGEGELVFPKLLEKLSQQERDVSGISGVYYKSDGRIFGTRQTELLNIENMPMLPYHLVDVKKYIWEWNGKKSISIFSSRGCPFQCIFCINTSYNQSKWRAVPAQRTFEEVDFLIKAHQVEHIQFLDDNFFVSKERVLDILELFLGSNLKFSWSVLGGHVNDLIMYSEEELGLLYKSGLRILGVGVESGSGKLLNSMKKRLKIEDLITLNKRLYHAKIVPFYSYISGLPDEGDEDLKETLNLMLKLKEDNPDSMAGNIKPVMCYPGTTLYNDILKIGFQPPQDLEEWGSYNVTNYENIKYPWLTKKRKIFLLHLYYVTLLLNPEYIFVKSKIYRLAAALNYPITILRIKNFNFNFLILPRLLRYIHKRIL